LDSFKKNDRPRKKKATGIQPLPRAAGGIGCCTDNLSKLKKIICKGKKKKAAASGPPILVALLHFKIGSTPPFAFFIGHLTFVRIVCRKNQKRKSKCGCRQEDGFAP
jgi:hypothetical protein